GFIICSMVQLHKCKLDLLVTIIALKLVRSITKYFSDMICQAAYNIKQLLLSCCFIISDCRFNHMTSSVQLMRLGKVLPLLIWCLNGEVSIQIAVRLLCLLNNINHLIRNGFKFSIGLLHQQVGNSFKPFGNVCILKHEAIKLTLS